MLFAELSLPGAEIPRCSNPRQFAVRRLPKRTRHMTKQEKSAKLSWLLTFASIAIVVGGLYLTKGVLIPYIVAGLVILSLSPVCDWLERRRKRYWTRTTEL